jgi:hypothetical protein
MSKLWPPFRYEQEPDREQENENLRKEKEQASEALSTSYNQLEYVRKLNREHEPIRKSLKRIREKNGLAEGLMRVIEEGR